MTLLVSALSHDCIWQVVDRQLTYPDTGAVASTDTNKAIFFAHRFLVAYTGPARIASRGTADWIAEHLAEGADENQSLSQLVGQVNQVLRRWTGPRNSSALEIDAVGWDVDSGRGTWAPRLIRISNCIDQTGTRLGGAADEVAVFSGLLKPHVKLRLHAAGQPVPTQVGHHWERIMRNREAAGAPPREIGRCLVHLVRDVARHNAAVGSGVLLSALPLAAFVNASGFTIADMPRADVPTFKYFPEGDDLGVDKGPEVADPGGLRITNFWGRTDSDGTQTVQAGFRLRAP